MNRAMQKYASGTDWQYLHLAGYLQIMSRAGGKQWQWKRKAVFQIHTDI